MDIGLIPVTQQKIHFFVLFLKVSRMIASFEVLTLILLAVFS